MFCLQCGKDVKEGAKFCAHCGSAVPAAPVQNTQPTKQYCSSCGIVLKAGAKFCPGCGTPVSSDGIVIKQDNVINPVREQPAAAPVSGAPTGKPRTNKLIFIAAIVAVGMWVVYFVITCIDGGSEIGAAFNFSVFLLVFLAIPIVLSFLGWKKNIRTMVFIACIVYFVTVIGIPSGILCIIAYKKMKKPATPEKFTPATIVLIVLSLVFFPLWMIILWMTGPSLGEWALIYCLLYATPVLVFPILLLINKNQIAKIIGGILLAWWLVQPFFMMWFSS